MSFSSTRRSLPRSLQLLGAAALLATTASATAGEDACTSLAADVGSSKVLYAGDATYLYEYTHYYDARSAQNKPACVYVPESAADVRASILAVKAANSSFAIKSGGHTGNGDAQWSSTDGGVLIDLKNMDDVVYSEKTESILFGAGNRFLNVYKSQPDANVTIVGGRLSDVGVGGWHLGGGLSYLSARYGLGVDNYVSLEVVLPSGEIVNATGENEYKDLFYALQGGGNQFGVVTTFETSAIPVGTFIAGDISYDATAIPALVNATEEFVANYTDPNAAIIVTLTKAVGDLPVPIVFLIYNGDTVPEGTFSMFEDIPHGLDTRGPKTYLQTTTMNDFGSLYGPRQAFWSIPIAYERLNDAYALYSEWTKTYALDYTLVTLDLQPIPASLVQAGVKRGGNPIFTGKEGSFIWLNFLVNWDTSALDSLLMEAAYNFTQTVGPEPGLPIFLNDADWMQNAQKTYADYDALVQAKAKYDPEGFFTAKTGGPSYS